MRAIATMERVINMSDINLSLGSLQDKNGKYQAVFAYRDKYGKTKRIWRSTGIPFKRGNKTQAKIRMNEIRAELLEELTKTKWTAEDDMARLKA